MPRLTTRQKHKIITEYVEGDGRVSQRELAEKYNVSQKTVSKILSNDNVREMVSKAKNDSILSMIEYIKAKSQRVQRLVLIIFIRHDMPLLYIVKYRLISVFFRLGLLKEHVYRWCK